MARTNQRTRVLETLSSVCGITWYLLTFLDHAETQINFISDNLLTLISLISSAPILEGNTRIQNAQGTSVILGDLTLLETAEEGELIDPEQLSYLSFLIGGSQTLERFDLEVGFRW